MHGLVISWRENRLVQRGTWCLIGSLHLQLWFKVGINGREVPIYIYRWQSRGIIAKAVIINQSQREFPLPELFIHFLLFILAPGWTQKLVIPSRFHSLGIKFWNKENKILIDSKIYKDWLVAKTPSECLPKRIFYFLFHRENLDNKIREQIKKKLKMQI